MRMNCKAVLFDMDGTVLNTLNDLTGAVNYAMAATGHWHDFTARETGAFFGSGALVAVARALCAEAGRPLEALEAVGTAGDDTLDRVGAEAERVLAAFKAYYPTHCEIETKPYPGVLALMRALREHGVKIAVVSNKLDAAMQTLCARHFPGLVDFALGERDGIRRKPAPDMIAEALRVLGVSPAQSVYVGDSEVDLETAKNAGLKCVAVSWGFRGRRFLEARGAERIAGDAETLLRYLTEDET